MALRPEHELHRRRFSRNMGLGLVLLAFVALVFGLTIVKVANLEQVGTGGGGGSVPQQSARVTG